MLGIVKDVHIPVSMLLFSSTFTTLCKSVMMARIATKYIHKINLGMYQKAISIKQTYPIQY